jgi:hypothetical protein
MKRYLFAACFALLLGSAQANALYILFEPYCMDRLEYVYANQEGAAPHIAYHINVTPAEKIILDIGVEDKSLQPNLPAQVMRCNSGFFDQRLVNDINSKIRRVYIVVKMQNDSYLVAPVLQAARYLRAEDFLAYDSPDYRFEFDLKMGVIGENIALSNPGAKVFFQGKLHNECSGALLFRQIQDGAARPRTDLTLVPELGLVEIRNGINADDAMNNALRLPASTIGRQPSTCGSFATTPSCRPNQPATPRKMTSSSSAAAPAHKNAAFLNPNPNLKPNHNPLRMPWPRERPSSASQKNMA